MLERNENITNGLRLSVVDLPKLPERYSIHRKKSDTKLEMKKTEKTKGKQFFIHFFSNSENMFIVKYLSVLLIQKLRLFSAKCSDCVIFL